MQLRSVRHNLIFRVYKLGFLRSGRPRPAMGSGSPGTGPGAAELCPALAAARATAPAPANRGHRDLHGALTGPRSATPRPRGETAAPQGRHRDEAPERDSNRRPSIPQPPQRGLEPMGPPTAEQQHGRLRAPP